MVPDIVLSGKIRYNPEMFTSRYPSLQDFLNLIERHPERGLFLSALANHGWPSTYNETFTPQPGAVCDSQDYIRWFAAVRTLDAAKGSQTNDI